MLAVVAPPVSRPVNVALVIEVGEVRTKSSADSISNLPALAGRVAVAILPSALPVLNNSDADAGTTVSSPSRAAVPEAFAIKHCIVSLASWAKSTISTAKPQNPCHLALLQANQSLTGCARVVVGSKCKDFRLTQKG